jgi:hypothetical protein
LTTATTDPGVVFLWQQDVTKAKKRIALLVENKRHSYALVLGQCSPELKSIKGADSYVQANCNRVVVQLLLIIRGYCCRFNDKSTKHLCIIKGEAPRLDILLRLRG